ncbi:MAG: hypothetical protein WCK39_01475 [Methanomassiliicoccales archaeon]
MEELKDGESKGTKWGQRTALVLLAIGAVLLLVASTQPLWQVQATSPLLPDVKITVSLRFWDVSYAYPGSQTYEPISELSTAQQGALQLYLIAVLATAFLAFIGAAAAVVRYRRIGLAMAGTATLLAWAGPLAFMHFLPISINQEPLVPFIDFQFGFWGSYEGLFTSASYGGELGWMLSLVSAAFITAGALLLLWYAMEPRAQGTNV